MKATKEIIDVMENMTLAELKDELELVIMYEDKYPQFFKSLLLYELEKRSKTEKEAEE